jgi:hypothetical protein
VADERAERLKRFERWVAGHDLDVRKPEVTRVAGDLLEIAGAEPLREADVDALVKRYKQGLAGAQRVLAAQRVGELMLQCEAEAAPSGAAPAAAAFEEPEQAPKSIVPGPKVSTWARPATHDSSRPPPLFEDEHSEPSFSLGGVVEEDAAAPEPGEFHARLEDDLDATAGSAPPQRWVAGPPVTSGVGADLDIVSASVRPRARGIDAPPPSHFDIDAAEELKTDKSSRPPPASPLSSRPPASGAFIPGVAGSVSRSVPPSVPPGPRSGSQAPASYPIGALATAQLQSTRTSESSNARLYGGLVFVAMISAAVAILFMRPSCMFPSSGKPVSGPFVAKYLGLQMTFPGQWLYGEDLNDKEKDDSGYVRKIAVFYQGTSATEYAAKLEVLTIFKDGETPSEDVARNNGAREVLDQERGRNCGPLVRGTVRGTRCTSISLELGSAATYSTIEDYFPLGSYTVFVRGRVKLPSLSSAPQGPSPQGGNGTPPTLPTENKDVMARLDEIDDVVASIDIAR